ncbi:periplasmic nitrate reductase, NapE protein [Aestuariirhabdus sp. Z084]|nr:periplasmic nitrate reductase, NapE protein [Aestuariirhabdus haliotis]MCL6417198.1 periplasmic nitrate reductase, NapE protein [Aestuariirhabdus haliotis]MCL6421170.1 periplasmic nitrate reductase, NapE protein [Aestuariirhabdus haliotis]
MSSPIENENTSSRAEWLSFLFITVLMFPILSVILVGGYGFIIWMLQ